MVGVLWVAQVRPTMALYLVARRATAGRSDGAGRASWGVGGGGNAQGHDILSAGTDGCQKEQQSVAEGASDKTEAVKRK